MNFMTTERLLDKLEELLNSGKKQMFSNMRLVDANSCLAIIQQIRSQLPTELSEAIVILRDCDKLKENAEHEASEIINAAQAKAQELVSENEITKEGERKAAEYVNNAGQFADNLVEQSYIQVNNMYIEVENVMRQMLDTVIASRESLFVPEDGDPNAPNAQADPQNFNRTNEPRRG
ncbi:MAG: hypothetical protein K2H36_00535 [Clostridia bacterium]|nr:hypothetical protein [Clostridia bacterium]MDE6758337.1 hypothetical protein [Clostridia bacterium]